MDIKKGNIDTGKRTKRKKRRLRERKRYVKYFEDVIKKKKPAFHFSFLTSVDKMPPCPHEWKPHRAAILRNMELNQTLQSHLAGEQRGEWERERAGANEGTWTRTRFLLHKSLAIVYACKLFKLDGIICT